MKIICHDDTRFSQYFAQGADCELKNMYLEDLSKYKDFTVALTGLGRLKLIRKLKEANINYFFIDRAYLFDNGKKNWMRISYNSFQMKSINDNLINPRIKVNSKPAPWKKTGENIILCPPSKKTGEFYGFNPDDWTENTYNEIKKYSDRPIIIREKPPSSERYSGSNSLSKALENAWIIVIYNSNAATEAIYQGIPAMVLAEDCASRFVSRVEIKDIEKPYYPDRELWIKNILYNQFTIDEIKNGRALRLLRKLHKLR